MFESPDIESSTIEYAKRFSGPVGEYFLGIQQKAVDAMIVDLPEPLKILDIGGGHAQLTPSFVRSGHAVTVFGSDQNGRKQLDDLLDFRHFEYCVGNLLDLPFENNSFDVVVAIRLLAHLENWEHFISEMSRVAKCAVVIDYPEKRSANYFADRLFGAKQLVEKDTRPYNCFSYREIADSFSHSRFQGGGKVKQFFIPMVIHRALGSREFSSIVELCLGSIGLRQWFGSPVIAKFVPEGTMINQL